MATDNKQLTPNIMADEDAATMMQVVKKQLCQAMDMNSAAEKQNVFGNIHNLHFAEFTDALEVSTYCHNIQARVSNKMWSEWEREGLIKKMEKFCQRVANYEQSAVDAKMLENPSESLLNTGQFQKYLRNILHSINKENDEIMQLLTVRHTELREAMNKLPADSGVDIVEKLTAENNLLDAALQKVGKS